MSTASDCSFKNRIRVHSDERVPKGVYSAVQCEVVELVRDLFRQAGVKDSFPSNFPASASMWDTLSCPIKSKIVKIGKPELADFVEKACRLLVERCYPALENLSSEVEEHERRVLRCQEDLIAAQKSLVEAQDRLVQLQCQLLERRDTEISAVQSTAQKEIKSFADVLQKNCDVALAPKRVQRALEIATEDRGNNLIMYGLGEYADETAEDLSESVKSVIGGRGWGIGPNDLGGCQRLGKIQDGRKRPVIFRVASGRLRDVILQRKSELRNCDDCNHIYISPDRSPKEREERRRLVAELKERRAADPGKAFVIKSGKVVERVEQED